MCRDEYRSVIACTMLVEVDNEGIRCSAIEKRSACLCAHRCATVPIACNHGRGSGWLDNHNPSPLHHSHGGNRHRASDHRERWFGSASAASRSEEHTSELQS